MRNAQSQIMYTVVHVYALRRIFSGLQHSFGIRESIFTMRNAQSQIMYTVVHVNALRIQGPRMIAIGAAISR